LRALFLENSEELGQVSEARDSVEGILGQAPRKNEPKVWFESTKSMSQVLSAENQDLLRTIINTKPHSITELEEITNRKKSNLSRTLKTLEKYGIVELKRIKGKIMPEAKATDFIVEFGLHYSCPVPQ